MMEKTSLTPYSCFETMRLASLIVALTLIEGGLSGTAAAQFDPALRFHVLSTEHFLIYYHDDEDVLARRLAPVAESTWRKLIQPLGVTPPPLTHVVLVDQTDVANGAATPVPYNTIVRVSTTPRAKSRICSNNAKQASTSACQVVRDGIWSARYASMNRLNPNAMLIMAAITWLRVNAEATQPSERNKLPSSMIPRNVLPIAPASSAAGLFV